MLSILVSVVAFVLQTLTALLTVVPPELWDYLEIYATALFTSEYLLRFLVCDVFEPTDANPSSITAFLIRPQNNIDLGAILPFWIELAANVLGVGGDPAFLRTLRTLRLLRLLRVLKMGRYFEGLRIMGIAIQKSFTALKILLFLISISMTLFASLVYYGEKTGCPSPEDFSSAGVYEEYYEACINGSTILRNTHPEGLCCVRYNDGSIASMEFPSIVHSLWWAVVTMTTVGYGDMVPRTTAGKIVATVTMLCGILMIALPVAIVGSKFQEAYEQKVSAPLPVKFESSLDNLPPALRSQLRKVWVALNKTELQERRMQEAVTLQRQLTYHTYSTLEKILVEMGCSPYEDGQGPGDDDDPKSSEGSGARAESYLRERSL
jgi:hypothetical protein